MESGANKQLTQHICGVILHLPLRIELKFEKLVFEEREKSEYLEENLSK